jgi:predicted transcriptional regulator
MESEFKQDLIYANDTKTDDFTRNSGTKAARARRSPSTKTPYRSEVGIMLDMLDAVSRSGREGIVVSAIVRMANVSYNSVNEKCQKLKDAGLIGSSSDGKNTVYFLTEKGLVFFEQLRQFTETIRSMNIRY